MFRIQVLPFCLLLFCGVKAFPGYAAVDYHAYPKYSFKYGVNDAYTGDVKQHSEHRDGDVVKGQYSLVEPDGSVRQVEYTADPINGFNAVVLKSQPSVHPAVVKPVAVVPPPVSVPKPLAISVAPAPVKFVQSAPVHYGAEQIVNVPFAGHPFPYASEHDAYNAYIQSRHFDYGHY